MPVHILTSACRSHACTISWFARKGGSPHEASIQQLQDSLARELGRVVIGADAAVRQLVIALVARGHVLVQGVPGLGKTLLAKALRAPWAASFKRIQGTGRPHAQRHHRRACVR